VILAALRSYLLEAEEWVDDPDDEAPASAAWEGTQLQRVWYAAADVHPQLWEHVPEQYVPATPERSPLSQHEARRIDRASKLMDLAPAARAVLRVRASQLEANPNAPQDDTPEPEMHTLVRCILRVVNSEPANWARELRALLTIHLPHKSKLDTAVTDAELEHVVASTRRKSGRRRAAATSRTTAITEKRGKNAAISALAEALGLVDATSPSSARDALKSAKKQTGLRGEPG
jgi:hypothetical protein